MTTSPEPPQASIALPVSMFADAYGKVPKTANLGAILEAVRTGRWRTPMEAIRQTYTATLAATGDAKAAKAAIDLSLIHI